MKSRKKLGVIFLECEICGASGAEKKAQIGESELVVCDKCASLGKVKERIYSKTKTTKNRKPSSLSFKSEEKILKRNFGGLVRSARESEGMKMEELAKKLGEKESVIRRIENGKLKPDEALADKIERELELKLYTEYEENFKQGKKSKGDKLTIGDVAEVK